MEPPKTASSASSHPRRKPVNYNALSGASPVSVLPPSLSIPSVDVQPVDVSSPKLTKPPTPIQMLADVMVTGQAISRSLNSSRSLDRWSVGESAEGQKAVAPAAEDLVPEVDEVVESVNFVVKPELPPRPIVAKMESDEENVDWKDLYIQLKERSDIREQDLLTEIDTLKRRCRNLSLQISEIRRDQKVAASLQDHSQETKYQTKDEVNGKAPKATHELENWRDSLFHKLRERLSLKSREHVQFSKGIVWMKQEKRTSSTSLKDLSENKPEIDKRPAPPRLESKRFAMGHLSSASSMDKLSDKTELKSSEVINQIYVDSAISKEISPPAVLSDVKKENSGSSQTSNPLTRELPHEEPVEKTELPRPRAPAAKAISEKTESPITTTQRVIEAVEVKPLTSRNAEVTPSPVPIANINIVKSPSQPSFEVPHMSLKRSGSVSRKWPHEKQETDKTSLEHVKPAVAARPASWVASKAFKEEGLEVQKETSGLKRTGSVSSRWPHQQKEGDVHCDKLSSQPQSPNRNSVSEARRKPAPIAPKSFLGVKAPPIEAPVAEVVKITPAVEKPKAEARQENSTKNVVVQEEVPVEKRILKKCSGDQGETSDRKVAAKKVA
ncbi:hypothetical protein BC829DRAFT_454823 [Chytridium lagenaria]|nr:hypothetical protein BC829DRAFT_454823 [Chytridium lagenaria]